MWTGSTEQFKNHDILFLSDFILSIYFLLLCHTQDTEAVGPGGNSNISLQHLTLSMRLTLSYKQVVSATCFKNFAFFTSDWSNILVTADKALICCFIACFFLPSLVNKTPPLYSAASFLPWKEHSIILDLFSPDYWNSERYVGLLWAETL